MTTPSITVPDRSRIGEPFPVTLAGFSPSTAIELELSVTDGDGRICSRTARLETGSEGEARLEEGGAVLWDLAPPAGSDPPFFVANDGTSFRVEVAAESPTEAIVAEATRVYVDPNIDVREVTDPAVGTIFEPEGEGPFPGVLVLHGSDPNLWETLEGPSIRELLASHGYTVLSLRYIGEGTPTPQGNFVAPLSSLESAIDWLRNRPSVADGPVGAVGVSRGGEGVLQAGAALEGVGSVVAYVPSVYRFPWPIRGDDGTAYWGDDGEALPYVPTYTDSRERSDPDEFRTAMVRAEPDRLREARIRVEELDGPVLLVSGLEDAIWPSTHLSEIAVAHLIADGNGGRVRHEAYDGAGHGILAPYRVYDRLDTLGGTAEGTARAAARAWPHVLRTLEVGLR